MTPTAKSYRYHAFLSYRHLEPDRGFAWDLLQKLEGAGFKVAIDERDFEPQATFLEEMERCIRESRFTLAVLTRSYLESGDTLEEGIIAKVRDMGERRRRLIPLTLELVERPVWLYDIVGVDFAAHHPSVNPFERLVAALQKGMDGALEVAPSPKAARAQPPAETRKPEPERVAPPTSPTSPPPPARRRPRLNVESLVPLLEGGIGGLEEGKRPETVLRAIEDSLPLGPESLKPLGLAAWALDSFPGRSSLASERAAAQAFRGELLAPLRGRRPQPPLPDPSDPDWAEIPAGSFDMGTPKEKKGAARERPVHRVMLSSFRLLVHPVTNREYRSLDPKKTGEDYLPVVEVDWYTAYAYAAWLGGRLPTEAEWEYAARAGCRHAYSDRYGAPTTLDRVGWHSGNSEGKLHPVEQLEMNPWGLFDMIGNVWEWVADWYGPYSAEPQTDPWGSPSGDRRVMRGGCFRFGADRARAACRDLWVPGVVVRDQGFRVVLPVAPELGS